VNGDLDIFFSPSAKEKRALWLICLLSFFWYSSLWKKYLALFFFFGSFLFWLLNCLFACFRLENHITLGVEYKGILHSACFRYRKRKFSVLPFLVICQCLTKSLLFSVTFFSCHNFICQCLRKFAVLPFRYRNFMW